MATDSDNSSSQPCHLLAIPPELRLMIYDRLSTEQTCDIIHNATTYRMPITRTTSPACLLSTCKQILDEAKPSLYGKCTMRFFPVAGRHAGLKRVIGEYYAKYTARADFARLDSLSSVGLAKTVDICLIILRGDERHFYSRGTFCDVHGKAFTSILRLLHDPSFAKPGDIKLYFTGDPSVNMDDGTDYYLQASKKKLGDDGVTLRLGLDTRGRIEYVNLDELGEFLQHRYPDWQSHQAEKRAQMYEA